MTDQPRDFIPKAYQGPAIDFIVENERCNLFARMGMGKSVSALTALDKLHVCGYETKPALVLGPLRVARDVWPKELKKWRHLSGMDMAAITGTETQRLAALRRDVPLYSINYENLTWLQKTLGDRWPFGMVIADESTKLKSFRTRQGSQRAAAIGHYAFGKGTTRWLNLTGTPTPNGLKDLWGQLWFTDRGQRLGRSYSAFTARWFQAVPNGNAGFTQLKPLPHAEQQIQDAIRDISLTLDPRDYFDLAEPIVVPVVVELPPAARKVYRDMEKAMFATIGEKGVEAFNAGARTMKCQQIANGFVYENTEDDRPASKWVDVHDVKLQALDSILEETGGTPLLVAYNFKPDLAKLLKAFPKGVDLSTQKGFAAFMKGGVPIGFAHPASLGHGVDGLQDITNLIAFFGHDWNLEYYEQMIERVGPMRQLQSGYDRNVFVYHIIAEGTIDEDIVARRASKASVQDALMSAMKRFERKGVDT